MDNDTIDQPLSQKEVVELKPAAIRFGFIAGFASVLASLILYLANLEYSSILKWLPAIIMIVVIIAGQQQMAKTNSNFIISFGKLFKAGVLITLIAAIFLVVYFLVYISFIEPDFIEKILDVSRAEMEKKGLAEEQIEAGIEMTRKFMSPVFMVIMSFISNLITGTIFSLIGAAIFKNEK